MTVVSHRAIGHPASSSPSQGKDAALAPSKVERSVVVKMVVSLVVIWVIDVNRWLMVYIYIHMINIGLIYVKYIGKIDGS